MPALALRHGRVDGADVEHGGGVKIAGVHHVRDPLKGGEDHGLFPGVQGFVTSDEGLLQGRGRGAEGPFPFRREMGVHLPLIYRASFSVNEAAAL